METTIHRWGISAPATPRAFEQIPPASTPIVAAPRKWSTTTAEDKFFFVNGGEIFRWPSTTDPTTGTYQALVDIATGGTPPRAKFLEYFNNQLFAGYTIEGSDTFAYRVRWAVDANHLDWGSTTSGFLDFFEDSQEPVTQIKCLGDRLVVYKEHAIIDLIATGILLPRYTAQVRVRGFGSKYSYTIASNGMLHFFLGTDSRVYVWNGIQTTHISEDIDDELDSLIDGQYSEVYFGACAIARGEYWLILGPYDVFVYDYLRDSWSRDSFPSIISLAEVDDARESYIWLTIPGTWEEQTQTWDQLRGIQYTTLWGGREDGAVFQIDDNFIDDYFTDGSIIDRFVETPDYYLTDDPMEQATLQRVTILYDFVNDTPFEFSYSFDRGRTWTATSVTPQTDGQSVVNTNASGNVIRFRFRENNATGQFRWKQYVAEWLTAGSHSPTPAVQAPHPN